MAAEKIDNITKKIIKIYQNYGIDVSSMSDDEFERIRKMYEKLGADIDKDLNNSEQHSSKFVENIL